MATLTVSTTTDFRSQSLTDIDSIDFAATGSVTATFNYNQFGPGLISNSVVILGDANANNIIVHLVTSSFSDTTVHEFSASSWTFNNWISGSDSLTLFGTDSTVNMTGTGSDVITGSSGDDTIYGGSGLDMLHGGAGNDRLVGGNNTSFPAGGTGPADKLYGRQ